MFDDLEDEGHFYDPVQKEVREVFLPWIMDDLVDKLRSASDSVAIADGKQGLIPATRQRDCRDCPHGRVALRGWGSHRGARRIRSFGNDTAPSDHEGGVKIATARVRSAFRV